VKNPDHASHVRSPRIRFRWYVLGAIPPVAMLLLARHLALALPVYDYWDALWASFHYHDQGPRAVWEYYLAPFVDQQMFFPKVVIDRLANWTANRHYGLEILLGWLAQCAALGVVWILVSRSHIRNRSLHISLILASSLLLFWPVQLFRFQNPWYSTQYSLVLLPGLLCLLFLRLGYGQWRGILAAMVPAGIAAYSHGTGVLLLLAVGVMLLPSPSWRQEQKAAWWAFTLVAVASVWAVSASSPLPPVTSPWTSLQQPIKAATFFCGCLAPPIVQPATGAMLLLLGLGSLIVLQRRKQAQSGGLFPWLTIFVWCVGTAAATTFNRFQGQLRPSQHYFGFFVLFLLAVLVMAVTVASSPSGTTPRWASVTASRRTAWLGLAAFLLLYGVGVRKGVNAAVTQQRVVQWSLERLAYAPLLVDRDFRYLFPFTRFLTSTLPALGRRGVLPAGIDLSPFARAVPGRFTRGALLGLKPLAHNAGKTDVHDFQVTDSHPRLDLLPASPIPRDQVVSLDLDPVVAEHAVLRWDDGNGWKPEAELFLRERCRDGRTYRVFFHDRLPGQGLAPVKRLQLAWPGLTPGDLAPILRVGPVRIWSR
jgi:hypothetical protein